MKVSCHGKKFIVYNKQDAESLKLPIVKDWRKAKKGDWVHTSDDMVVQIIKRTTWKRSDSKKPTVFITTGYGDTPVTQKHIYARKSKQYNKKRIDDSRYKPIKNVKTTTLQRIFLDMLAQIAKPTEVNGKIFWDSESIICAYQNVYKQNNPEVALKRGHWVLNKKTAKEYMSKLMKEQFDELSMDDAYVAFAYKAFLEDKKVPHSVKLSALNRISELRGHNVKETLEEKQTLVMLTKSPDDKKLLAETKKLLYGKDGIMVNAKES